MNWKARHALPELVILSVFMTLSIVPSARADTFASSNSEAQKLYEQAMALVEESLERQNLERAVDLFEKAAVIDPSSEEIWIQISVGTWLLGEDLPKGSRGEREERKKLFEKGATAGERAMALNKRSVGGLYWHTVNRAALGEMRGVMSSLSLAGTIFSNMSRVDRRDPYYFYGATRRLVSEVFVRVPAWLSERFGFKTEYIEEDLLMNIEKWPNYFANYTYLARVYVWAEKMPKALEMLDFVLKTPADIMPEKRAENVREQRIAREMWKEFTGKAYPEN